MKKSTFIFIISTMALFACSSNSSKSSKEAAAPAVKYDTEKTTTYAEYKEWRKKHDPASEAYAEYKEWEIAYRKWKAAQER